MSREGCFSSAGRGGLAARWPAEAGARVAAAEWEGYGGQTGGAAGVSALAETAKR
jgi:hypothetical protein